MAQRPIREFTAKQLLAVHWTKYINDMPAYGGPIAQVGPETDLASLAEVHPWLRENRLVAKPDVGAGRRGKHGLLLLNATWEQTKEWLEQRRDSTVEVGGKTGKLTHFLVEPFVRTEHEYYLALRTERDADVLFFSTSGGVDIEENWDRVASWRIPVWPAGGDAAGFEQYERHLAQAAPGAAHLLGGFARGLYGFFRDLGLSFLELNPLAVVAGGVIPLDMKARIDDTAQHDAGHLWGDLEFPPPFGRASSPEERFIEGLDARSGASLKLTVLNPAGTIWTMVAGGGASVIYADTIADLGFADKLANYGEYSGNPTTAETYQYARTILGLMTASPAPPGETKHLIIGGGIANFTDVAKTFDGIIQAIREHAGALRATPVSIHVRRGGPNYAEGLRRMADLGVELGVPIEVYGPELHMTRIVSMALGPASEGGDQLE